MTEPEVDRTSFIVESCVLAGLSIILIAAFSYSIWGRDRERHSSHHSTHASGRGSTTSSPLTSGTNNKYTFRAGGGPPEPAKPKGFPYYGKRIGLATCVICLIWCIDLHGSLQLYPMLLVSVLPDVAVTGLLATCSVWLYFHTLPLYRQLRRRTKDGTHETGDFPVWFRTLLVACPLIVVLLNGAFDLFAVAADRLWGVAVGQLIFGVVMSCYVVLVPVVTLTLRAELNRFSASMSVVSPRADVTAKLIVSVEPASPLAASSPQPAAHAPISVIIPITPHAGGPATVLLPTIAEPAPSPVFVSTSDTTTVVVSNSPPQSPLIAQTTLIPSTSTPTTPSPGPVASPLSPTSGGGLVIDTSYIRSAIRTMFIFGGISCVLGVGVIITNTISAVDVLSDGFTRVYPAAPAELDVATNFSLYVEWFFLTVILWVSWDNKPQPKSHAATTPIPVRTPAAAAAGAGGRTKTSLPGGGGAPLRPSNALSPAHAAGAGDPVLVVVSPKAVAMPAPALLPTDS